MLPRLTIALSIALLGIGKIAMAAPSGSAPPPPSAMPPPPSLAAVEPADPVSPGLASCAANINAATIKVVMDQASARVDRSLSLRALTKTARKLDLSYDRGRDIWAFTQNDVDVDVSDLRFGGTLIGSALCVYPLEASVKLHGQQTIKVARTSPRGSCWDKLVLERERRHAAIDADALQGAVARIEERLVKLASLSSEQSFAVQQADLTRSIPALAKEEVDAALKAAADAHQAIEGKGPVYDVGRRCAR